MFLAFLVTRHPAHFLLMISEGLVVALLLIRRPSQEIAKTPFAWMVAGIGTFGPLLVTPTDVSLLPWSIMIWLNLIGTLIAIAAKGSLGRSFGIVAANRGIKVGGLYQLVRHPMYAGYFLTHVGYLLSSFSVNNLVLYSVIWCAMLYRIREEEVILSKDPEYEYYAHSTRYRLIPGFY